MERKELDPWRVILHHLFLVDTREIPKILDRAGLAVDWALEEKEDYSAKTRLAAYRPRIVTAYEALNAEDRLRVAYTVTNSFEGSRVDELDSDLRRIGWKIESGRLAPVSVDVSELFFPTGSQHDAYVEIRRILQRAKNAIAIVDPYVDATIFTLLTTAESSISSVRVLTHKHPLDFDLEARKFQAQYPKVKIEARTTKEFHDRFVVVDDDLCWHIGCSIKDAGVKAFMISQVEDARNRDALLVQLKESWESAVPTSSVAAEAKVARSAEPELKNDFELLRRKVLYCGITNDIPVELKRLRTFLVEKGLVERPEFRRFFDRWLSSPFISLGVPVANAFSHEQMREMEVDLRALQV